MPETLDHSLHQMDFRLRRAARRRRAGRRRLGADEPGHAADRAAAPPTGRAGQSDVPAAGSATRDHRSRRQRRSRPRTTRSAATRMPPPGSRANSTASPRRPSGWAATVPDFSRCSAASRRNAARSTTRSSRCAAISTRSPPASSGCAAAVGGADRDNQRRSVLTGAGAEQLRPAIRQRGAAAGPGGFLNNLFGEQQQSERAERRHRAAVRHLSHRLRAHLRRLLFPDLVRHRAGAFRRRREDLQGAVPGDRSHAVQPIAIPAKTSTRRCRSAASPTRRCRTRSNTARNSIRPAPARPPARPGPMR